ncbi:hypothetical protein L211DRAFT_792630, partial [Terfezia boudieri ATCC MYA-4762]
HVYFYDASKLEDAPGGLIQNGSVTEAIFLQMLGIVLAAEAPVWVQHRSSGHVSSKCDSRLELGTYDVYCDVRIYLSFRMLESRWIHRIQSFNVSGRHNALKDGIRALDGKCVISGAAPFDWRCST